MTTQPTNSDDGANSDRAVAPERGSGAVTYGAALRELEAILVEIEDDDIDIDLLGPHVERAAALIQICRDRIRATRLDVERIVADLALVDGPTGSPEASRPDR